MKILHVNAFFGTVGGTEVYLSELISGLRERDHACEVVAERDSTDGSIAPFHSLDSIDAPDSSWTRAHSRRFREIVDCVRPDLIHLHNTYCTPLVAEAARLRPTVRSVHDHRLFCPGLDKQYADGGICEHAMGSHCRQRRRGTGCIGLSRNVLEAERRIRSTQRYLAVHRNIQHLLVASRYMRDELLRVGLTPEQIRLARYGVSVPPARSGPAVAAPLVVAACRMVHGKGINELLAALRLVPVPFRAMVLGDGPRLATDRRRCSILGLDEHVTFPGFVSHSQVLEAIATARVVAFPSMWGEPFGLVGIEAMALGRPVVAFEVGGVRDWLEPGVTGLLVPRGDIAGYASALTTLLNDPALAAKLGDAGANRAREKFTREKHISTIEDTYRDAVRQGPVSQGGWFRSRRPWREWMTWPSSAQRLNG